MPVLVSEGQEILDKMSRNKHLSLLEGTSEQGSQTFKEQPSLLAPRMTSLLADAPSDQELKKRGRFLHHSSTSSNP